MCHKTDTLPPLFFPPFFQYTLTIQSNPKLRTHNHQISKTYCYSTHKCVRNDKLIYKQMCVSLAKLINIHKSLGTRHPLIHMPSSIISCIFIYTYTHLQTQPSSWTILIPCSLCFWITLKTVRNTHTTIPLYSNLGGI